jgi:hypothetical protein
MVTEILIHCLQDIDHMNNRFQTLTLDPNRFPAAKMRKLVDKMNAAGQQWVPIHVSDAVKCNAAAAAAGSCCCT